VTASPSWQPFTSATTTVPTARLTEWAGLLRQLSVHVPLEGPALTRALEAAQLMQWWADGHGNTPTPEETRDA
jgi:hypothetical protein